MHEILGILLIFGLIMSMMKNNSRQVKNMAISQEYYQNRIVKMANEILALKDEVKVLNNKIDTYGKDKTQQTGKNPGG